jgi:hypothetical protein
MKNWKILAIIIIILIFGGLSYYILQPESPQIEEPISSTIAPTQEIIPSHIPTPVPESKPEPSPNGESSSIIFSIRTAKVSYRVDETIHVIIRSERSVPEKYYWFVENIHNEFGDETRYHRINLDSPLTLHSLLTNYQFSAKSPGQVRLELVWFQYAYEPTKDEPPSFNEERVIFATCYYTIVE